MNENTAVDIDLELADEKARQDALDIGSHALVKAPAGSGKTTLLTLRAMACLRVCEQPEEVLCITFTTKAANEMRTRIMAALERGAANSAPENEHERAGYELARAVLERDAQMGWGLRLNPSRLRILTIDALNRYLANSAPVVSGFGGGANVQERPTALYREAVLALLGELDSLDEDDPLRGSLRRVMAFGGNRAETLVPLLATMLQKRDQWLPMLATHAGSDELDRMVRRIVSGLVVDRVQRVGEATWSGHLANVVAAGCEAQLWDSPVLPEVSVEDLPRWRTIARTVLTADDKLRARLNVSNGFPPKMPYTVAANAALGELRIADDAGVVTGALSDLVNLPDPAALDNAASLTVDLSAVLLRLSAHLTVVFQRRGEVDFIEVAMRAAAAVRGVGGHQPLAERLDYEIRHILLDEAQDTSASQYDLILALTEGWVPGDGRSIFIVGDPQQSIYIFREAEVRLFMDLWHKRRIGHLPLKTLRLAANFRSAPAIVEWCNRTFTRVFPSTDDLFAGAVSYSASVAKSAHEGGVRIRAWEGTPEIDEAMYIADEIARIHADQPSHSIAVLVRSRNALPRIIEALKRADIEFSCQDIEPLSNTAPVRDVIALVRALWHEGDRVAWGTLFRAPFIGLSWADCLAVTHGRTDGSLLCAARKALNEVRISAEGRRRLERLLACLSDVREDCLLWGDLADAAEAAWHELGGPACVTEAQARDVRQVFALLRNNLTAGTLTSPEEFEEVLAKLYAAPATGIVDVMTIHRSKGLEWDHVFLAGLWRGENEGRPPLLAFRHLEEGSLIAPRPVERDDEAGAALFALVNDLNRAAERSESLRVLYVGMTRPRRQLHLTLCVERDSKGELRPPGGTLQERIWGAIAPQIDAVDITRATELEPAGVETNVIAPRLCDQWSYPQDLMGYQPPDISVVTPSETVVRAEVDLEARDINVTDRVVGILYHETMQYLCDRELVDRWEEVKESLKLALQAGMRRRGMPEPQVVAGIERVQRLVTNTLASRDGRWIVAARHGARNETRMAGYVEGSWVSCVADRLFVEDGTLFVIDYKTSGAGVSPEQVSTFLKSEAAAYRRAMELYARTAGAAMNLPTVPCLYFPEFGLAVDLAGERIRSP